jgi:hypothetical protein
MRIAVSHWIALQYSKREYQNLWRAIDMYLGTSEILNRQALALTRYETSFDNQSRF